MPWRKLPDEEVLKTHPNLKDFLPFLNVHNQESPRGSVLVACSFLEKQLEEIIDAFLIEDSDKSVLLQGFNAPLGTFSARIKAAHCLGLITDTERDDCDTLRKIRNEFAHSHKTTFDDQRLVDLTKNLHNSIKPYTNAKDSFSSAAVGLCLGLVNRAHYVRVERLKKRDWKR